MFYNTLEDIEDTVRSLNPQVLHDFENSCFSGRYVSPEVTPEFLLAVEAERGAGRIGARTAVPVGEVASCSGADTAVSPESKRSTASARDGYTGGFCESIHNSAVV